MRSICTLALILTFAATSAAQSSISLWKTLSKITYKKEYDELMGFKVDVPVFSNDVLALEGKTVEVKGYIIPVEGYKNH